MRRIRLRSALVLASFAAALLAAGAAAFGVVQEPLPTGIVGQDYRYQFKAQGGNEPYTFTVASGGLPPGLSLSSSGLLTGKPTQTGSWSFYIQGSYSFSGGPPVYSERQFTLGVIQGLVIEQGSLPTGTVGSPYSAQLTASGGGTQTWSISAGGLPGGLALASNGLISGTPTALGKFDFTVKVTDGSRTTTKPLSISVIEALKLTAAAPGPAVVGSQFTWQLQGSGGVAPYTWAIAGGAWPKGLVFDDGTISGKPRIAGTYGFVVELTDSLGNKTQLPLTLVVQPRLKLPLQTLAAGKVGRRYVDRIETRGGAAPLFFELDDGLLPRGLRLGSRTGAITGTPRESGRFSLLVRVTDQLGGTHTRRLVLRVNA
jgi:hypothetical protein